MHGHIVEDLYRLNVDQSFPVTYIVSANVDAVDLETWHSRLGHPHYQKLQTIIRGELYEGGVTCTSQTKAILCQHCIYAKHRAASFPKQSTTQSLVLLQLVHSDVCGPVSVPSLGGGGYFPHIHR